MRSKGVLANVILVIGLFFLAACGTLSIQIEPIPAPRRPGPTQVEKLPPLSPVSTPTSPTPTLTPAPTATRPVSGEHLAAGTPLRIIRTRMLSAQNGWGIAEVEKDLSQHVLFTSDGGQTWQDRTPLQALENAPEVGLAADAFFASSDNAWVIYAPRVPTSAPGSLVVWRTTDGGKTWVSGEPLDMSGVQVEFQTPSDLAFLGSRQGWIMVHIGAGMSHDYIAIFTTADSGATWKRVLDPETTSSLMTCNKTSLAFTSSSSAWITGNCPGLMPGLFFYHSTDGGVTWNRADLPVPPGKPVDYFTQDRILCGIPEIYYSTARSMSLTLTCSNTENNTAQSWLYTSNDGEITWIQNLLPMQYSQISMLNTFEAFLVGSFRQNDDANSAVFHTTDGGSSWNILTSTGWMGAPDFVDSLHGWVVARHNQVSAFVHSSDGGITWVEIKPTVGP